MLYAIPNFFLNFNLNLVTLLEFLNRLQTFNTAHDPTISPWNFYTNNSIFN